MYSMHVYTGNNQNPSMNIDDLSEEDVIQYKDYLLETYDNVRSTIVCTPKREFTYLYNRRTNADKIGRL